MFMATVVALNLTPASSHAIDLRIRGEAKLAADVKGAGTALQVSGALRDELGAPLAMRDVGIQVVKEDGTPVELGATSLATDIQGKLSEQFELEPGVYMVRLKFTDASGLLAADVATARVELKRLQPKLELRAPDLTVGRSSPSQLKIRASADGIGVRAPAEVFVNGAFAGSVELDERGRGVFDLSSHMKAGENEVGALMRATRMRPEARDVTTAWFAGDAELAADLSTSRLRLERGLIVSARVTDGEISVPGATMSAALFRVDDGTEGKVLRRETGVTRGDGRAEIFFPTAELDEGLWSARVTLLPDAGARVEAMTGAVELDRTSSRWLLNVLGLVTVLAGAAALMWRLSMTDWRAWWRRKDEGEEELELSYDANERVQFESFEPGDDAPVGFDAIGGFVWDHWRAAPVPLATITLERRAGGEPIEVVAGRDGGFVVRGIPRGVYALTARAHGFAPGVMEVSIPHDGKLRACRVGLVAIPLKVRRFYQAWIARTRGKDLWGHLSPRQIEDAIWDEVSSRQLAALPPERVDGARGKLRELLSERAELGEMDFDALLTAVTDVVEESYFSGRSYDDELWELSVSIVRRLDAQLGIEPEQGRAS